MVSPTMSWAGSVDLRVASKVLTDCPPARTISRSPPCPALALSAPNPTGPKLSRIVNPGIAGPAGHSWGDVRRLPHKMHSR